ncbi:MAG: HD domain-containing protein [Nitrospirae bacterium]|nr:HD domain-containing protein [Nitrospirota bacterium]
MNEIIELYDEMLNRLIIAAEYRDTDVPKHIIRIKLYSEWLSRELKMSQDFIESIKFAAALHDIGKIGIPYDILFKQGGLSREEFVAIKNHSQIGANILEGSNNSRIQMAASIALNHHERCDGSGYPNGIKKNTIPIEAKIVTICDQYDALMMKKPYKPSYGHKKSLEIITKGDGRTLPQHFDQDVLSAFKKIAGEFESIFNTYQDLNDDII